MEDLPGAERSYAGLVVSMSAPVPKAAANDTRATRSIGIGMPMTTA